MTGQPLRIAVIGGGIGGLTAALSLRQAGFEADIYEQAPALTHIGGGINMGPNAARVLIRLGLGEGLLREGVRPASTHQRRWDNGRTLQRAPLNPQCEELYGAPHVTIHRADLLAVISSGLPLERVHLGHRLLGFSDKGDHVEAWFDNGARIEADILVGADGIHSAVRAILFGDEAPKFAGCVAYRGLVPVERLADLQLELGSQSWVGPGGHLVHYFVSRGELLNFVGWTEHDEWSREDWTDRAAVDADPAGTLRDYERIRLPRVMLLQAMSRANKIRFHMPDGLAQRARDGEWAKAGDRGPHALRWLYEHDPAAIDTGPA